MTLQIYTASKFARAEMWRTQFKLWKSRGLDIQLCARWVTHYAGTVPDTAQFCKIGWRHDIEDVKKSDLLLIYAEPEDKLRGALIEAGAALAFGKHVITIGEHPDYGTWKHHQLVHCVESINDAELLIKLHELDKVSF